MRMGVASLRTGYLEFFGMSKMVHFLLRIIGHREFWHVSWQTHSPARSPTHHDTVVSISPRLTKDSIADLRKNLALLSTQNAGHRIEPSQILIFSLARIAR